MRQLAMIAFAGALGTLARYGVSGVAYHAFGDGFPYGTLAVNAAGCFLIGFVMLFGLESTAISSDLRVILTVGFLGGFTTFSTFGYETMRYLESGAAGAAFGNIAANVVLGLAATWAGMAAARALLAVT